MGLITVLLWGDGDLGLGLDLWDLGGWTLLIFFFFGGGGEWFVFEFLGAKIYLAFSFFFVIFWNFFFIFPNFFKHFFLLIFLVGGFGVGNLLIFVQHSLIHSHNFFLLWVSVSVRRCAFFGGGYQTSAK